jgi:hypothetical protein
MFESIAPALLKKREDRFVVVFLILEPTAGLEPATYCLRNNCSTN